MTTASTINMKRINKLTLLLCFSFTAYAECEKHEHPSVDIDAYYMSTGELKGDELKSALNEIIRDHYRYSYTPCVWEILMEADEDPNNTNNVIEFYTRRSVPKSNRDQGQNDPDSWNREHIWAKSHGFPNKSQHAYTDAHHLRVADRSVNSDRSDNDFDSGGESDDECAACREGAGTWEPPDEVKGDVARMMFYMAVRYEGNDTSNTPDLELLNRRTDSGEPYIGKLCTLYNWHAIDQVSESEIKRNDIIYSWQGNRNPFVDHPEYVELIWAKECDSE